MQEEVGIEYGWMDGWILKFQSVQPTTAALTANFRSRIFTEAEVKSPNKTPPLEEVKRNC